MESAAIATLTCQKVMIGQIGHALVEAERHAPDQTPYARITEVSGEKDNAKLILGLC